MLGNCVVLLILLGTGEIDMRKSLIISILIFAILAMAFTGCGSADRKEAGLDTDEERALQAKLQEKLADEDKLYIDADPQSTEVVITLYYKHEIADFLVPEQRKVQKDKQSLEQLVVEELLKGPQGFGKLMVMPTDVEVIDVTRKADTVFVNLSEEFKNDVDLSAIPGKQNIAEEDKKSVLADMKRLAIYSIVNSITDIEGGLKVKFLVDNKQLTYEEIGTGLLVEDAGKIEPDTPMAALNRDKDFILCPSRSVEYVLKAMTGKPNYDVVYKFLASKTADGSDLPSIEEFKRLMTAVDITLETDDNPIDEEEIKSDGNTAYVTTHFTIKYSDGKKEVMEGEVFTVVREDGIWKVILPNIFNRVKG